MHLFFAIIIVFCLHILKMKNVKTIPPVISISERDCSCEMYATENLNWCNIQNFYVNGHDGLFFPLFKQPRDIICPRHGNIFLTSLPMRGYVNISSPLVQRRWTNEIGNATTIEGRTWITNCWRRHETTNPHPNHFMMGMGNMIAHMLYNPQLELPDTIILHQCVNHKDNDLHSVIMSAFDKIVGARKRPRIINIRASNTLHKKTSFFEPTYFVKQAEWNPKWNLALPLGPTGTHNFTIRKKLINYLPHFEIENFDVQEACKNNHLRIGIFVRSGGWRRRFTNLHEVIRTARKISSTVFTFTTNSDMTFIEQAKAYNTFDILVTPHGSHNFNSLWIKHSPTASIEISDTKYMPSHWNWITDHVDWSEGHIPDFNATPQCEKHSTNKYCDIIVNLTKLESKLNTAKQYICNNI